MVLKLSDTLLILPKAQRVLHKTQHVSLIFVLLDFFSRSLSHCRERREEAINMKGARRESENQVIQWKLYRWIMSFLGQ